MKLPLIRVNGGKVSVIETDETKIKDHGAADEKKKKEKKKQGML